MYLSTIRELKAIVDLYKVFLLPKIKSFCFFVTILAISFEVANMQNDYFIFNVGISKFISENMPPNIINS
jgi:hypothetical protein